MGMESKKETMEKNGDYKGGFYDKVVFSKTQAAFGGKVRLMVTGSAPIKRDVQNFMKTIMACPLIEGYGQT
jgi:long-chain acyl-CoA synthetase